REPLPLLIEGGELFGNKTLGDFINPPQGAPLSAYDYRRCGIAKDATWLGPVREWWPRNVSVGFGVWIDSKLPVPDFAATLDAALTQSNDLVWLYTENAVSLIVKQGEGTIPPAGRDLLAAIATVKAKHPDKRLIYDGRYQSANELRPSPQRLASNQQLVGALPLDGQVIVVKDLADG